MKPLGIEALAGFHPVVRSWFASRFDAPTDAQARGWPNIASGRDVLIAAPTGSGKTLAAFLACLDRLIRRGLDGRLDDAIDTIYISPLKALSNDVQRNLDDPLSELREVALREGMLLPELRTAVRTGDTPASERAKLVRKPPHILITTPESLYIMLTADKSRAALASVSTVIVDEIHAVAGSKRGSHLALSLERLDSLVMRAGNPAPNRVGLSATQRPIETIGQLLVGKRAAPVIIDGGHARTLDIAIEPTDDELGAVATNEQTGRVYDRIAELVTTHDTTLVFVNTRRMVERVAHALEKRLGEEQVVAHHGSLSRRLRFAAEQKLKSGRVRCAVATASLELGIDVGQVDLVVQIGSPRSIATLLQRIGRSGHSLGKTPKGRLFALTRDQLVESAALIRAIKALQLDAIEIPPAPLDVLAQQIVAEVACGEIAEDELFQQLTRALPYQELERKQFDRVIEILSEGISTRRGRDSAHLHRDRVNGVLKPRRGARLTAITNGGAIPDNFNYPVVTFPEETPVGSLDEDFAIESMPGDIFLLGNTSWKIHRIQAGRVLVEDAGGAPPTVPFWFGEAPARTRELSYEVARLHDDIDQKLAAGDGTPDIAAWVASECNVPADYSRQLVDYLHAGRRALGALPTQKRIIAERFFDEAGGMQLVLHSPLGGRINKAWGLALRKRFCRSFNLELQAAATDDGILISLGPPHSFQLETVFEFLRSQSVRKVLEQAVLGAPVFGVRWRWCVTRALAVRRRSAGNRVPPHLLRMRTDDLLTTVFPMQQACLENVVGDIEIPDHPLVEETMRDCLQEFMDIEGLEEIIRQIENGEIEVLARETSEPSPLCHELVNANPYAFLDDAPLEERRARAVALPRGLKLEQGDLTVIDREAIERAEEAARPPVRDADELHDALLSWHLCPQGPDWQGHARELMAAGRATVARAGGVDSWVAAERVPWVSAAIPGISFHPPLPPLPFELDVPDPDLALMEMVRGHMAQLGPRTPTQLGALLGIESELVARALSALEADGTLLCGQYSQRARSAGEDEWCDRRMLARIQRLTIASLRKEIEPVDAATLNRFLLQWQRLSTGAKMIGIDGLLQVIEQLQGFESAAGAWESELLSHRIHDYRSEWLDSLCLSGQVAWARLSAKENAAEASSNNTPTRAAPLALFLREDASWLRAPCASTEEIALSETTERVREQLARRGACFLRDLVEATGLGAEAVQDALWELCAAGLATADGFTSLRLLMQRTKGVVPSRFDVESAAVQSSHWRKAVTRSRQRDSRRVQHAAVSVAAAAGRWSLLGHALAEEMDPTAHARQLLLRYGVVFRDLLLRESALPPWREILIALRRLEARGEIRGGRFVDGFVGEQFALPEALDGLRALRRSPPRTPELVRVAATDPLNLVGITSAGPRVAAVLGNAILYRNGVPIASRESGQLVLRPELLPHERVDEELRYHSEMSPSRASQESLPL